MTTDQVWKVNTLLNVLRRLGVIGEFNIKVHKLPLPNEYKMEVVGYNPEMKGRLNNAELLNEFMLELYLK